MPRLLATPLACLAAVGLGVHPSLLQAQIPLPEPRFSTPAPPSPSAQTTAVHDDLDPGREAVFEGLTESGNPSHLLRTLRDPYVQASGYTAIASGLGFVAGYLWGMDTRAPGIVTGLAGSYVAGSTAAAIATKRPGASFAGSALGTVAGVLAWQMGGELFSWNGLLTYSIAHGMVTAAFAYSL